MLTDGLRLSPNQGGRWSRPPALVHTRRRSGRQRDQRVPPPLDHGRPGLATRTLWKAQPVLLGGGTVSSPGMVRSRRVDRMAELLEPRHFDRDFIEEAGTALPRCLTDEGHGGAVDGHLPPDIGARLLCRTLEQFAASADQIGSARPKAQRQADAIADISDASLDGQTSGASPPSRSWPTPNGSTAKWRPVGRHRDAGQADQLRHGHLPGAASQLVVTPTAVASDKSPWQSGCSRVSPPAQRAALRIRDGRCVHQGCRKARCHAHTT